MTFEIIPIIDMMIDFYGKPRTFERFQDYLNTLQGGNKGDLTVPISGFNPMAKEHLLDKLNDLKNLGAEQIISETINNLNRKGFLKSSDKNLKVAINLSDDLKGGWTNRFTSDYDSKFRINALVKRNFCIPVFWTGENYNTKEIIIRTLEYCYRTIYWQSHTKPKTLEEHIMQEVMVAKEVKAETESDFDVEALKMFYEENYGSTDYLVIFNFLYGDAAAASLGNIPLGIKEAFAGYKYAKWLASH